MKNPIKSNWFSFKLGILSFVLVLILSGISEGATFSIGYSQEKLKSNSSRDLDIRIWYPVEAGGEKVLVGENIVFYGFEATLEGTLASGTFPLVILSHGLNGNNLNQAWLAVALAKQGVVVVAPNHPGTTSLDSNSAETAKLWERPHDISRVVDHMLSDSKWGKAVDEREIAVIGHSLGGATALFVAGGRFSPDRFEKFCKLKPDQVGNIWYQKYQIGKKAEDKGLVSQNWQDERVSKVILLDPGLSQGFDPASLAGIDVPVLVFGAGAESKNEMPLDDESRYLAKVLPKEQTIYIEVEDASHFSFFPLMKPRAAEFLEEASPGDEIIAFDGSGRSREELHKKFIDLMILFLAQGNLEIQ